MDLTLPTSSTPFLTERQPVRAAVAPKPAMAAPMPDVPAPPVIEQAAIPTASKPGLAVSDPLTTPLLARDSFAAFDQAGAVNTLLPIIPTPLDAGAPAQRNAFTEMPLIGVYR
ncbi:hypothetical protein [Paracoccus sp. Ld10]|uniref:hypothetical protein n=1 Tax=Paracoccus sp. Ld10 TaxID=649158 RepID=UPI00386A4B44